MNTKPFDFQEKTELLTDAFRLFNELSENLANSYQGLQQQVALLTQELAAARHERHNMLLDKDRLTLRLQQILSALPAAVIIVDANGLIIDCNTHASDFLGEPVLNLPWCEVMSQRLSMSRAAPLECHLADGRIVSLTLNPLGDDGEQLILLSEISELRHLQDSLAQQQHLMAMGEMVASLAHQVRTPLATAILYACHIVKPELDEGKRLEFSAKILKRLYDMERQVNDMLIFARQGHLSMQGFLLRDLLDDIQETMMEVPILFKLDNQAGVCHMLGHQRALRGALLNLLNNAVEANAQCVRMTITLQTGTLCIEISDDGGGMPSQQRQKIFEPFFTTKSNGTGLGLAVVQGVIAAHRGSIDCDSALGVGSRFWLRLPCAAEVFPINLSSIESEALAGGCDHENL